MCVLDFLSVNVCVCFVLSFSLISFVVLLRLWNRLLLHTRDDTEPTDRLDRVGELHERGD